MTERSPLGGEVTGLSPVRDPTFQTNMTVYYAHPMSLYGTPQEARDIETLRALGFEVVNPGTPEHQEGCKGPGNGMDYFRRIIQNECQALAFRAFPDGKIGAGVAYEIEIARGRELPVFELPSGMMRRVLDIDETRNYLAELGQR